MKTLKDLKEQWNGLDKKMIASEIVKGCGVAVVMGLTMVGAIVVGAIIIGSVQQKLDPEGFQQELNEEKIQWFDETVMADPEHRERILADAKEFVADINAEIAKYEEQ